MRERAGAGEPAGVTVEAAVAGAASAGVGASAVPRRGAFPGMHLLRVLLRRRDSATALVILAAILVTALFGPSLLPYGRDDSDLPHRNQAPSWAHPCGTDDIGRDTLVRVLHGARVSLAIALLATSVAVGLGTLLGATAGYAGGRLDGLIMHGVDVALCLPTFFVLLVLAYYSKGNFLVLCAVIGFTNWMPVARLVRGTALSLRDRPFVEAARALGFGAPRIVLRHVLPSTLAPILVAAAVAGAQAILLESALSYLGFGVQPPTPTWGNMLRAAQDHLQETPWAALFPGGFIFATVLALHLLADGARDAFDPRLEG